MIVKGLLHCLSSANRQYQLKAHQPRPRQLLDPLIALMSFWHVLLISSAVHQPHTPFCGLIRDLLEMTLVVVQEIARKYQISFEKSRLFSKNLLKITFLLSCAAAWWI